MASRRVDVRSLRAKMINELNLSGPIRPRQGTEIWNFGAPSPLETLHWIFCSFSRFYLQFSKKSPRKAGESSKKSSGENRVKSCHVCVCHGFFGPESVLRTLPLTQHEQGSAGEKTRQREKHAKKPPTKSPRYRDAETTILIKFAFWRGSGRGKIYGRIGPKTLFFLRNSMTIKFGNSANFIVRNFVVIWEAPIVTKHFVSARPGPTP